MWNAFVDKAGARAAEVRRWGLWLAVRRALLTRAERWFNFRIYRIHEGASVRPPFVGDERVEVPENTHAEALDLDTATQIAKDPLYGISPQFVEFCFAHGHQIWGLFIEGRLVNYVVRGRTLAPGEDGLVLRISEQFDYDYKAFTVPDARGRGYAKLRAQIMRDSYAGARINPLIGYISIYNYPSLRATDKEGMSVLGYAGYWHVFGQYRFFSSKRVREANFRFDYPTTQEKLIFNME